MFQPNIRFFMVIYIVGLMGWALPALGKFPKTCPSHLSLKTFQSVEMSWYEPVVTFVSGVEDKQNSDAKIGFEFSDQSFITSPNRFVVLNFNEAKAQESNKIITFDEELAVIERHANIVNNAPHRDALYDPLNETLTCRYYAGGSWDIDSFDAKTNKKVATKSKDNQREMWIRFKKLQPDPKDTEWNQVGANQQCKIIKNGDCHLTTVHDEGQGSLVTQEIEGSPMSNPKATNSHIEDVEVEGYGAPEENNNIDEVK